MNNETTNETEQRAGTVVFLQANPDSKSEGVFPFLYVSKDEIVKLFFKGDNPFENTGLLPYDGKRVELTGRKKRNGTFVVEQISEAQGKGAEPPAETDHSESSNTLDTNQ